MQTIKIEDQEYDISELKAAISMLGVKPVDARPIIKAGMLIGPFGEDKPWWYITPEGKWSIIGQRYYASGVEAMGIGARLDESFKVFEWPAPTSTPTLDEAAVRAKYGFQVGDVVSIKGEGEFGEKHPGKGTVTGFEHDDKFPYQVAFDGGYDYFKAYQLTLIEPSQGLAQ